MTEYFEIHNRDGPARYGELRLTESISTPTCADDIMLDAGSLWTRERSISDVDVDTNSITILPHRAFPAGASERIQHSFDLTEASDEVADDFDMDVPVAVVVTPETADSYDADAYVLSNAQGFIGHASEFCESIIKTRNSIPTDTALYLTGVATPRNVATLAYAGVDLVDTKRARARGLQGFYLTTDNEYFLEDLTELSCSCPACKEGRANFNRKDCADHNAAALQAALTTVRQRIRHGRLRDYLEAQSRHDQWLIATLRTFDQQYKYSEKRTPIVRDTEFTAASEDTRYRPEVQRFANRVTTQYQNRFSSPLVLVPSSTVKPYSESQNYLQFRDAIRYRGHLVSISSQVGVVPMELELTYPAQQYSTVPTGRWSKDEISFAAQILERYLMRNEYSRVIAHVPDRGYGEICERVDSATTVSFEYTVVDNPTTTESLTNLMSTLEGESRYSKRERQHNIIKAMTDYQFGNNAGETLFADADLQTTSQYPKLRVRDAATVETGEGQQLAAIVSQYGVLAFTLAGARMWDNSDVATKRVEIDQFVPHGNVLAPGIVDADTEIRVGDEVIVEGSQAYGVGRAQMFGAEMIESTRGEGVKIRHMRQK
ncbi:archaeosine synthase subunit alpha [Haloquadratum walsbyi]|jgi:Queuine tRNA-ribosyltransferases, contain PUA domain|uniref:tRNA-archaeosine synthase n=1 Tax=Haloquadratum walsbyi J07HQW2 TaxID=1238425 RepID=U1NFC4_9EURY|nr:archaeosine synthase subunit alpha [Haloquadratum walsbyi]ERG95498.1 MAG: tRNA-archaeosine synthase [Haloquadratum walsbyi J07HQW2]